MPFAISPVLWALVSWVSILSGLASTPAEDQFGEEVRWAAFAQKPFVLVVADRDAAEQAKAIGAALQSAFNSGHTAAEEHLRTSPAQERVKIIPVAALPDVPGMFKWMFRKGMKKEASFGVILDWDSRLAKAVSYRPGSVTLAVKLPASPELRIAQVTSRDEAQRFVERSLAPPSR